ncbi:MAG: hypothetical protein LBI02_04020 [Opitutaceae bacterium]|jgi:hypothetical protein|nr:hypothetical protein [Opitutaceae bacterium]
MKTIRAFHLIRLLRKSARVLLPTCLLFALCGNAPAMPGYGPFSPAEKVRSVRMDLWRRDDIPTTPTAFAATDTPRMVDRFIGAISGSSRATLELIRPLDEGNPTLRLTFPDGRAWTCLIEEKNALLPHLVDVFSAYLNEDDQPDMLVLFETTACGLAAERSDILFILSTKSGYRALLTETWNFDIGTIIDWKNNREAQWIQTLMWYADSSDRKTHLFWIHRLLAFRGDKLCPLDEFTPRWRMYTFKPNHTETPLLTKTQKEALFKKAVAEVRFQYLKEIPN